MKKKLSLMLCLCIMALTLAACGSSDPQDVDYGGMSYSDLQSSAQNLVTSIAAFSDEELSAAIETNEQYAKQYAKQYGREYTEAEAVINLLQSWLDSTSDVGTFVGLGEFSIDKTSDTVTVDQIVNFSERDVDVTFVYEYNYLTEEIEMTDATADIVYTLGEKLEKAALNTLMGMGTVFCVLILISLIIYCFRFIPMLLGGKKNNAKGIKVVMGEGSVTIEIQLVVKYGVRITDVAASVQENVKNAVEEMTGFTVEKVDVRVVGIKASPEAKKEEAEKEEPKEKA